MAKASVVICDLQSKDISSKPCTKCGAIKSIDLFARHSQSKDGRDTKCKVCKNAKSATHYANNRERLLKAEAERYRANPSKVLAKSKAHYERNKAVILAKHKEWKVQNSEKVSAIRIAYAEKFRDKHNAYARNWMKNNPESAKSIRLAHNAKRRVWVKSKLTGPQIKAWVDDQPKQCFYCGCHCDNAFEIDHFHPLSKGGLHKLENLRIACQPCNRRKSAKDPYKFIEEVRRKLAA